MADDGAAAGVRRGADAERLMHAQLRAVAAVGAAAAALWWSCGATAPLRSPSAWRPRGDPRGPQKDPKRVPKRGPEREPKRSQE